MEFSMFCSRSNYNQFAVTKKARNNSFSSLIICIITILLLSLLSFSCGKKDDKNNVDQKVACDDCGNSMVLDGEGKNIISYKGKEVVFTNVRDMLKVVNKDVGKNGEKSVWASEINISNLGISPKKDLLVSTNTDNKIITIRNMKDGSIVSKIESKNPSIKAIFSPDQQNIASGDKKGLIQIWNLSTLKEVKSIDNEKGIIDISYSKDGKSMVIMDSDSVKVRNVEDGKLEYEIKENNSDNNPVRFALSDDGKKIAVSFVNGLYTINNFENGSELLSNIDTTSTSSTAMSFSPDGKMLALSYNLPSPVLKLYEVETGNELQEINLQKVINLDPELSNLKDPRVWTLLFSASGKEIYVHFCKKIKKLKVNPE